MHENTSLSIRNISRCRQAEKVPVFPAIVRTSLQSSVVSRQPSGSFGPGGALGAALMALCLVSGTMAAQAQDQQKQNIPDAPSATRPFPNAPLPSSPPPSNPGPSNPGSSNPGSSNPGSPPPNQPPPTEGDSLPEPTYAPGVAPPFKVTTVPEGGATAERSPSSDEHYKIVTNVNQVLVPVMVTVALP